MASANSPKTRKLPILAAGDWMEQGKLPDFSNATPSFLSDELGDIREAKKHLEKMEGLYKDALNARRDPNKPTVIGERYDTVFSSQTQVRLNADLARANLTPEQLSSIQAEITFTVAKSVKHPDAE